MPERGDTMKVEPAVGPDGPEGIVCTYLPASALDNRQDEIAAALDQVTTALSAIQHRLNSVAAGIRELSKKFAR
jgi:hypothetical protein